MAAISKAGTSAFFTTQGNAFTTRTASFIVQEHFPPLARNTPGGPLFGVQFSQLPCSDVKTPNLPLGLSGDPGSAPIYKNGVAAGSIGSEGDGLYSVDLNASDQDQSPEEIIAVAATLGFEPPPAIRGDQIPEVFLRSYQMSHRSFEVDHELEDRLARRLLDVFIRVGLVFALVWLCFHFFSPFLTMMLWALILAVTLYPLHQMLAKRIGGRQGRAATLIVVLGLGLIVVPTVILGSSFGDSVHELINGVKDNTLSVPAPPASVAELPIVGKKAHALWSLAHNDLPTLVKNMQPKIGELA